MSRKPPELSSMYHPSESQIDMCVCLRFVCARAMTTLNSIVDNFRLKTKRTFLEIPYILNARHRKDISVKLIR